MGNFLSGAFRAIQDLIGAVYYGTGMVTTGKFGSEDILQTAEMLHETSAWLYFFSMLTFVYALKVLKWSAVLLKAFAWFMKKLKQLFMRYL